jgi:hypothetical protein
MAAEVRQRIPDRNVHLVLKMMTTRRATCRYSMRNGMMTAIMS